MATRMSSGPSGTVRVSRMLKPGGQRPVEHDVAEHVLLGERVALEGEPEPLAHHAVGAVGPDEVRRPHGLLAGGGADLRGHPVGVLGEADQLGPALDGAAVAVQLLGEQALGRVLGQGREAVGHVRGQVQLQARDLDAVDVHDLPAHRLDLVERRGQHAGALPVLQRPRLEPDGLGVVPRLLERVDHPDRHSAPRQLHRRGQPDGAGPRHQDVLHLVRHAHSIRHRPSPTAAAQTGLRVEDCSVRGTVRSTRHLEYNRDPSRRQRSRCDIHPE